MRSRPRHDKGLKDDANATAAGICDRSVSEQECVPMNGPPVNIGTGELQVQHFTRSVSGCPVIIMQCCAKNPQYVDAERPMGADSHIMQQAVSECPSKPCPFVLHYKDQSSTTLPVIF